MQGDWRVEKYIKPAKVGDFVVERFTISKHDAAMAVFGYGGRSPAPGTYTRLMQGGTLWMSDTDAEIRDHMGAVYRMKGDVLVAGLGLGMVAIQALKKPQVTKLTVVEVSPEVVELVGSQLLKLWPEKLEIITADIFKWKPARGRVFDYAWFDVWADLCTDNLKSMGDVCRRFSRCTKERDCWGREYCKYRKRQEREQMAAWR